MKGEIIIQYLVRKCATLAIIYTLLAVSFLGLCTFIFIIWKKDFSPNEFMSQQSVRFQVEQFKLPELTKNYYHRDVKNLLSTQQEPVLFYADYGLNEYGKGVYFNQEGLFVPEIVEGRNFNQTDFLNQKNTILVSEGYLKNCMRVGNKYYYIFDGYDYEVVGIYKKDTYDANYYINFLSQNMSSNIINGIYYLDMPSLTQEHLYAVINQMVEANKDYNNAFGVEIDPFYNKSNLTYVIISLLKLWVIIVPCFLPTLLLLINISIVFDLWIHSRSKEFYAKYIIGLTKDKLKKMILWDNIMISIIGYSIGLFIFAIIDAIGVLDFATYKLNITVILYSFIIYLLIILVLSAKLYRENMKSYFDKIGGDWY